MFPASRELNDVPRPRTELCFGARPPLCRLGWVYDPHDEDLSNTMYDASQFLDFQEQWHKSHKADPSKLDPIATCVLLRLKAPTVTVN